MQYDSGWDVWGILKSTVKVNCGVWHLDIPASNGESFHMSLQTILKFSVSFFFLSFSFPLFSRVNLLLLSSRL
jgi:hypothetical protein